MNCARGVRWNLPAGVRRPVGSVDLSWQITVGVWIIFPFSVRAPTIALPLLHVLVMRARLFSVTVPSTQ